jgi:hypothetical protein
VCLCIKQIYILLSVCCMICRSWSNSCRRWVAASFHHHLPLGNSSYFCSKYIYFNYSSLYVQVFTPLTTNPRFSLLCIICCDFALCSHLFMSNRDFKCVVMLESESSWASNSGELQITLPDLNCEHLMILLVQINGRRCFWLLLAIP